MTHINLKILRFRIIIILIFTWFGGVYSSASLVAQQAESLWYRFDDIRISDPRLSSYNATGLRYIPVDNISDAKIYLNKGRGGFVDYYQSNDNLNAGAEVESYYRLNPTSVFYGKINYDYFDGHNMGGSYFMNPNDNPFDILETVDSTRGTKKYELYHLIGGVSVDLHPKISIGAKVDYKAGNVAKHKDLRCVNYLTNLKMTLGVTYRLRKNIEAGANYFFNRRVESMQFSVEGNLDKTYQSLISYGNFAGKIEGFNNAANYTGKENKTPMLNKYHGGSLQLHISLPRHIFVFNEFSFKSRKGYYGTPSSVSVVLTEHNSDIMEYKGNITLKRNNQLHAMTVTLSNENLKNRENIFRVETKEGTISSIKYYGKSDVLKKEEFSVSAEYAGHLNVNNFFPAWEIMAGADYYRRYQKASFYPFFRKQTVNSYSAYVAGKHNIEAGRKNLFSVGLRVSYGSGSGDPHYDGLYAAPTKSQKELYRTLDKYLYRNYEYLTSDRIGGNLLFRYTANLISGVKNYIQADYSCTKAFDIRYIEGDYFNTVSLTLGCIF